MRFGSLFSGIEAASVAWPKWDCQWVAEVDAFACAVLAHHYPAVPNLGDVTKVDWTAYRGSVDLIVGGSPCQDFSVAGLRAGLDGERGQLTIEFVRILERVRPRWFVWENVPGVLSADGGLAFGTFLGELAKLGYGFAYRVLDAQFFGVPQRRRRVFVVGYLGDWRRAAAVLFERDSLSGNPSPRREAGEITSALTANGLGGGGPDDNLAQANHLVAFSAKDYGGDAGPVSPTLRSGNHATSSMNGGVMPAVAGESLVRRLTPREAERLQGFPDDYTLVPYRNKPAADSHRYHALGNSFAVPVVAWIGNRISQVAS